MFKSAIELARSLFSAHSGKGPGVIVTSSMLLFTSTLLLAFNANAAGLMRQIGESGPGLDLKDHQVNVVIEDGYAITRIEQVFTNPTPNELEAIYHFPVPEKAVVAEFTLWIDDQPVIAEVFEKTQAREIYQQEKAAGRETGLTEKNQHYNFDMRVSPVRANDDVRVRLVYMQSVKVDAGIGRYVYPLQDGETDDAANVFWQQDKTVQDNFSFNLKLRSSYPVSATRLPAHPDAAITRVSAQEWQVSLVNQVGDNTIDHIDRGVIESDTIETQSAAPSPVTSIVTLDKDIVFYWRLEENAPAGIDLVSHKSAGATTGTFMLTVTPGNELQPIAEGRDWVFVLDKSGSMRTKYAKLTDGVTRALGQLRSNDRFRIIGFKSDSSEITNGWQTADAASIDRWGRTIRNTSTGGSTNLYAGIKAGLNKLDGDRTSALILVTDGEANVGVTEKKEFLGLMEQHDVRLFTAIMGNGANRPLLQSMTKASNGFAVSVSNSDDVIGKLMEFSSKATHEALHNVTLKINGVNTSNITPQILPSLYRGEQLTVMGHYQQGGVVDIHLSAEISGQPRQWQAQLQLPEMAERNPEIERLWAYASINDMQTMIDYLGDDSEYRQSITDLAIDHGMVTDYTSMVVMREEQMAARGIKQSNRDRRQRETQAAGTRASNPIQNTKADQQQPAFSGSRASYQAPSGGNHSSGSPSFGGGAASWMIALLLIIGMLRFRANYRNR